VSCLPPPRSRPVDFEGGRLRYLQLSVCIFFDELAVKRFARLPRDDPSDLSPLLWSFALYFLDSEEIRILLYVSCSTIFTEDNIDCKSGEILAGT
jgi:hypothetical protein